MKKPPQDPSPDELRSIIRAQSEEIERLKRKLHETAKETAQDCIDIAHLFPSTHSLRGAIADKYDL